MDRLKTALMVHTVLILIYGTFIWSLIIRGKRIDGIINLIQFIFLSITGQNQLIQAYPLKYIITNQHVTDMGPAFKNYVAQTLANFDHFWIYDSESLAWWNSTYEEPNSQF